MAAPETAAVADSSGPRFAPDDPRLPAPWKGLIDGTKLCYWNPETNVTQYEKPTATAALLPLPEGPLAATPAQIQQITRTFSQPSVQFGQVGQALHHERHAQLFYPQASLSGQQPQQLAQQPPFQYQQQPPPRYLNMYPQHGPYIQHQQKRQPFSEYTYQAGQQTQMPQAAYSQVQRQPMRQPPYNQGLQAPVPQSSGNEGQKPAIPKSAFSQGQQPQVRHGVYLGQQTMGIRIPQSQVQHPPQSPSFHQSAQASQLLKVSQSQGLQMTPQQAQTALGLQFNP